MADPKSPRVHVHLLVHRSDGNQFAESRTLSRVPCVGEYVSFPASHPRHEQDKRVYRVTSVLLFDLDGRESEPGPAAEVFAREAEEPMHWSGSPALS